MTNITVRNIPDELIEKLKFLSKIQRRSLNNEILIVLENGLSDIIKKNKIKIINKETQIEIWENLAGKWEDDRSTNEITEDIISKRTLGRDIIL